MTEQAETRSRVLLVEDEAMIAMLIEDMLVELGCDVVATAAKLDDAVSLAQSGSFDLAFLDLNLRGVASYPVAQALRERGIPFAFVTGYGTAGADPAYADTPVLQKPFREGHLEAVVQLLRARRRRP
jgi:CheY-like chemotaxis protein